MFVCLGTKKVEFIKKDDDLRSLIPKGARHINLFSKRKYLNQK